MHIIYIILGCISFIYLFPLCFFYTIYWFSNSESSKIKIGRFAIINSTKIFLFIKSIFLILIYIQIMYDSKIFFFALILFLSVIYFYSNYLEYSYQYGQNIIRKLYLFFGVIYLLTSIFLIIGFLIRKTKFTGLINILSIFCLLSGFLIYSIPKKEININLENFSFKSDFEVYNQLKLITLSMKKKKNNRKYLLDLASYWHKSQKIKHDTNEMIYSNFDNDQLELFIYKYIDKTYRTMIHKFNNSHLLIIAYSFFLFEVLNKYSKAYIILYDLFFTDPDLSFSKAFFIYSIAKDLQEKAFEIGFDKTDISYKFQCNTLINLISQISDIYINFWTLLLNSQEHQDINRLRDIGNKINEMNEKIEEKFTQIKKIKIKDKSIYKLYNLYKRDILNEINNHEIDEDFLNMDEYFNQNIISLSDLNSFISTSDFQFIICSGKEDNFGVILKISIELSSYFGYTDVDVIGQHLNIFLPEFMRKKHDELLLDRISKIKLNDKISNSLKRHIFYFKTSSKYIYPISLDVCTIFDEDGKATIFGKVDYDNIHIFHREVSANCHIITNENLIIQTFSHNCLHILELNNTCMNGSVEITKFIKEFYAEFFNRITNLNSNISKKIDKQKLKISILKEKYLTNQPEEIITFGQKIFKMNVEELKLNGTVVGYIFHFINQFNDFSSFISKKGTKILNNSKTLSPKQLIEKKKKLGRKTLTENFFENTFDDINGNYIPKSGKVYFDFENKLYQFNNKNLISINDYFNQKIEKNKVSSNEKLSIQNSSSFSSNYESITSEESLSNYTSSFSSSEDEKNENQLNKLKTIEKENSNYIHEFYKVNVTKITLYIYDYKKNIFIAIPQRNNSSKLEDLIIKEKIMNKITKKKINLDKNDSTIKDDNKKINNNNIENNSYFYKERKIDEVQNLKKYYTNKFNNSIKYAFIFIFFHIFFAILLGVLFFIICINDRNHLINNVELIRYLIKFGENSHSTLTYSFQLALLRNPKYTNFYAERERIIIVMKQNLIKKYQDCLKLLSSYQINSINLSKDAIKRMNEIEIYYYIIDDSSAISTIHSNMKTMISQYAYSIFNYANSNITNIHFLNKDFNFIILNSNNFFIENILEYISIMFDEFYTNLVVLERNLWIIASISLFFFILFLLIGIKIIIYVTSEKEKLLRYFFGIDQEFIKNTIHKCQKFIDLNKNNSFDSKYLISKPKIKIEEDVDIREEDFETDFSIKQNENNNNNTNNNTINHINTNAFFIKKNNFISDKKTLKRNGSFYIIYILTVISFILILMIHNGVQYRDIKRLLNIYYSVINHKSIFLIAYNYLRTYILYSCTSFDFSILTSNTSPYIEDLYSIHQYHQNIFESNLTDFSLPKNSSYYYNQIIKGPLYSYIENFVTKYNLSYESIGNNIANYGINALMIYYLDALLDLFQKINIFIEHSNKTGFYYNEFLYGTIYYIDDEILFKDEIIENYKKNNPFQLFNDEQLVELNVLNEEIYRPAVENFVEALSLDIDSYGQSIYSYIERYSILYFTIIIFFNLAFCIPYFFYKNKDINKVRQMLMIIPKDILFKIIEQVNGKKEIEDEW